MTVGVIGSGPAGLAVAAELNKLGHEVTVYERDEGPGGLMRFGVPDAKLEKWIIDRRVNVLREEGDPLRVRRRRRPRRRRPRSCASATTRSCWRSARACTATSRCPGRELDGVHFAMDYLYQRNRHVARLEGRPAREPERPIVAAGKRVVVVGGGDTGMDCISNALREGAADVQDARRLPAAAAERPRRQHAVAAARPSAH